MLAIPFCEVLPLFHLRVRNSWVEGRERKCLNAIAAGEGPRLLRVLSNSHLIRITPREASVTVTLKPGFYR